MARLAAGREAALNDLMERHAERLFHYLIRKLQNETEAADLTQETFVRVYQNRLKFDQEQKFRTWLYAIATNLSRDSIRWRSRHPNVPLEAENEQTATTLLQHLGDPQATPAHIMEGQERAEIVQKAVAALPEDLRTPLILAEYEERSQTEIAAILKCSPNAVEMRIYRARNLLRERLRSSLQNV